jgi:CheY-like chemotaxis protein
MLKKKVLVIDDLPDMRFIVNALLKKHQYDAVLTADALQAIAVAR